MKGTLFLRLLLVVLFGISYLACSKAVPVTRTESLIKDSQVHLALENIHNPKVTNRIKWHREEPIITERMELELHDYPPSGANNRHTPRAP